MNNPVSNGGILFCDIMINMELFLGMSIATGIFAIPFVCVGMIVVTCVLYWFIRYRWPHNSGRKSLKYSVITTYITVLCIILMISLNSLISSGRFGLMSSFGEFIMACIFYLIIVAPSCMIHLAIVFSARRVFKIK